MGNAMSEQTETVTPGYYLRGIADWRDEHPDDPPITTTELRHLADLVDAATNRLARPHAHLARLARSSMST